MLLTEPEAKAVFAALKRINDRERDQEIRWRWRCAYSLARFAAKRDLEPALEGAARFPMMRAAIKACNDRDPLLTDPEFIYGMRRQLREETAQWMRWPAGDPPNDRVTRRPPAAYAPAIERIKKTDAVYMIADACRRFSDRVANHSETPKSSPSAADFNAKLKARGFRDPSEEAQRMNLEDCERYLKFYQDDGQ